MDLVWLAAGLALLVVGAEGLVRGGVGPARRLGVSEVVIGLTLVAVGTSLPELVTSVIAALRRHSEIALGNILGSNIYNMYNMLGILSVASLLAPTAIPPEIARTEMRVMLAATLMLLPTMITGRIGRACAVVLLVAYGANLGRLAT